MVTNTKNSRLDLIASGLSERSLDSDKIEQCCDCGRVKEIFAYILTAVLYFRELSDILSYLSTLDIVMRTVCMYVFLYAYKINFPFYAGK